MRSPAYTQQFRRDVKKAKKQGKDLQKLSAVILALIEGRTLDLLRRDHQLVGNYRGRRECHVEADWLLIYKIDGNVVVFERTGSHSDLFEK
jgi:mRNA interferase YafQ